MVLYGIIEVSLREKIPAKAGIGERWSILLGVEDTHKGFGEADIVELESISE